jgi:ribonuclease D
MNDTMDTGAERTGKVEEKAAAKSPAKGGARFGARFRGRSGKKSGTKPATEPAAGPGADIDKTEKPGSETGRGAKTGTRPEAKAEMKVEAAKRDVSGPEREGRSGARMENRPAAPPEKRVERKTEPRPGPRREAGSEAKQEKRTEAKPAVISEAASETKAETRPDAKQETKTTYVDKQGIFDQFINVLRRQKRFGIDLEADSLHHYQEKICLIQIAFPGKIYLVDTLADINLGPLARILTDSRIEKTLHGADYDGRLIMSHLGVRLRNAFDTMLAAQILGKSQVGLAPLLTEYFKVTVDKKHQRADWSRRPLAPSMLEYAGMDAEYLLSLRDILARELEEAGRVTWALEEFELLEAGLEILPGRSQEVYRIKGDRELDPSQAAVLQALLRWREGVAKRKDIPPFKIIPNEMLIKLAQSGNEEVDAAMAAILTQRLRALYGPEIQKALNRGRSAAPLELPSKPGGESRRMNRSAEKRLARLKEWRNHFSHDLSLDPGVMLPNAVMEAVAIANPRDLAELIGTGLLKRWQLQLFGEALLQILHSVR